ncbi:hypothetical protein TorRG33x02_023770 [Trema orientale]|uniref:Uncharacterized protein n=1 Tax=Trema orientale TaxID=63057 RepID=A0A2P5FUX9_TREOI|nr:hypothetical protein TorRG33x02_023770 [Trema orientale]
MRVKIRKLADYVERTHTTVDGLNKRHAHHQVRSIKECLHRTKRKIQNMKNKSSKLNKFHVGMRHRREKLRNLRKNHDELMQKRQDLEKVIKDISNGRSVFPTFRSDMEDFLGNLKHFKIQKRKEDMIFRSNNLLEPRHVDSIIKSASTLSKGMVELLLLIKSKTNLFKIMKLTLPELELNEGSVLIRKRHFSAELCI